MRSVALWGLVSLALLIGLGAYLAPLQPNLVALQLTFTPEAFNAVLAAWQPAGVTLYRSHLPVDGLLLLSYGVWGYLLGSTSQLFSHASDASRRMVSLLTPLAALADSGENLLHWLLTGPQAHFAPWVYTLSGVCASLKWTGFVALGGAVVWAVVWRRVAHPSS